ncbi:hypothetical protein H5410_013814 [Solanum commersonii]|uniref:Uncharacterized protein n=1 Tax=Solanum commersonii TaxID=4109 RepID=A0A9J5ZP94_SOLCO|nr:hypothetical protein H5410_013814 [Solanum commersonii]
MGSYESVAGKSHYIYKVQSTFSRVSATHTELSALGLNTYLTRINPISSSLVKDIEIYDGVMHSLLFTKTDENIRWFICDILAWLNNRY